MTPSPRPVLRSGMTMIEILAVMAVVVILALLLLPVIGMSRDNSRRSKCGMNQSQIMGACIAYAQQEEVFWPAPWVNTIGYAPKGQAISAGVAAMNYTFGCFEVLANEATLPNGIFRCDGSGAPGPTTRAQPGPASPELSGGNWADAGGGSSRRISYAFDWASPGDPGAIRIVFSDRDLGNHRGLGVMVSYGDSHAQFLKARNGAPYSAAPNQTIGMIGTGVVVGEVDVPIEIGAAGLAPTEVPPDNIFNSAWDVPAGKSEAASVLTPGGGGSNRTFVK